MALRDWNNDGKNDFKDDFIEYTIINSSMDSDKDKHNNYYKKTKKGEISTFGGILSVILGLVFVAVIFTIFKVNIDKVPALVIIIMWMINSFILSVIAAVLGI